MVSASKTNMNVTRHNMSMCDKLKAYTLFTTSSLSGLRVYLKNEADAVIANLEAENERLKKEPCNDGEKCNAYWKLYAENERLKRELDKSEEIYAIRRKKLRATSRALWIMTAEWADAMCLASCNIANKFMSRDNFEVMEGYREKTIKKYRHRQVVFANYADYCRAKAEKVKEAK